MKGEKDIAAELNTCAVKKPDKTFEVCGFRDTKNAEKAVDKLKSYGFAKTRAQTDGWWTRVFVTTDKDILELTKRGFSPREV